MRSERRLVRMGKIMLAEYIERNSVLELDSNILVRLKMNELNELARLLTDRNLLKRSDLNPSTILEIVYPTFPDGSPLPHRRNTNSRHRRYGLK